MENPCYNCLCVPVCKHKKWNKFVLDCDRINEYIDEMESLVPLDSYRYIELKPLNQRYEVLKNKNGNCRWFRQANYGHMLTKSDKVKKENVNKFKKEKEKLGEILNL
jgi:hypothetical protein